MEKLCEILRNLTENLPDFAVETLETIIASGVISWNSSARLEKLRLASNGR